MNIVVGNAQGGLSALVPTTGPLDLGGNWQVLDLDGEPLYQGTLAQCDRFMLGEGLRPHCNCELIDVAGESCSVGNGWAEF